LSKTSQVIGNVINTTLKGVEKEVASRAYRASNELRNASLYVLRGQRSGRSYRVPHTRRYYTASAPGESPAVRTGIFRNSWNARVHVEKKGKTFRAVSSIESSLKVGGYLLGDLLEHGTRRMAPRPYKQAIRDRASPQIKAIYAKSYKN
jgi:hypothetical protein